VKTNRLPNNAKNVTVIDPDAAEKAPEEKMRRSMSGSRPAAPTRRRSRAPRVPQPLPERAEPGPAAARGFDDGVDHRDECSGDQQRADHVERAAPGLRRLG